MKKIIKTALLSAAVVVFAASAEESLKADSMTGATTMQLTDKWDKTFKLSEKVNHRKVTFKNRFGNVIAADVYEPKNAEGALAAIAVCGPFGAVKEQSSGLYAMTMAERGYFTIAFDPSFTGESSGEPRYMASFDINTEDFQAAVDYLSVQPNVDPERIGIIGICGWGGIALNAASLDTRIKATVASTMYDLHRVAQKGYFDKEDSKAERHKKLVALNAQRTEDFKNSTYARDGGLPDTMPDDAPQFFKDYYDYYKTKRGYHERSVNSNGGWAKTSALSIMNTPVLPNIGEIDSAVMILHGEKAHSRYMGETAFKELKGNNKSLVIVPGASHTDLYDRTDIIPFDNLDNFFKKYLAE